MNKITVLILFGGVSGEHEVSLVSAYSVLKNIDREKYDPIRVGITKSGKWLLFEGDDELIPSGEWENTCKYEAFISPQVDSPLYILKEKTEKIRIDVIIPAMHGTNCEDGTLQGLFELTRIPFVGPGCLSSAIGFDKATTKTILKNYGIPQAKSLLVSKTDFEENFQQILNITLLFGYPLFVKPSAAGSSLGITKVMTQDTLKEAILRAFETCDRVLIEEYVKGAEIEVAVMGNSSPIASVCGEIAPGADFYDYDTKYKSDTASYFIPARISNEVSEKVRSYAVKIYKALCCKGLSRVDFFVDGNSIVFNEINTLPGFTSISMYPKLMTYGDLSYSQLIERLIELALENK